MPDIQIVIARLDEARQGLNAARNAAEEWRRGAVSGVVYTTQQNTAIRATLDAGVQAGEVGIAATKTELGN